MLNKCGRQFIKKTGCKPNFVTGIARVREELEELAATGETAMISSLSQEMADVVLALATCAATWGVDLDYAVKAKHAENMRREWGPHPTIPGSVQHR